MKSVSVCMLPLLALTLCAEEISLSPFDTLDIGGNQQVKVLPATENKIRIIGEKDTSFTYTLKGTTLHIGDDKTFAKVTRPYRLEVYTSQPLKHTEVSTCAQVSMHQGTYNAQQFSAEVSTGAQLDIPEGAVEKFNIKTSTNGVFGQHSQGLCVSHVQGEASTHSTLYLPKTRQGTLECSTLATCYLKSFDGLELENSTFAKIRKVE